MNFGYATLQIIPSLKGSKAAIEKDLGAVDGEPAGKSIGSRISGGIGTVLKAGAAVTGAAVAGTLGTAITKGFGRLKTLDQANAKLLGLGHSAETVSLIMDNASAAVTGTAFGMGDAATVAASAVAAGIKPGEDLTRTLTVIGDAATIAGRDMGSMGAIFNKVAASNKVQMDTINQLHDAGVPALQFLADQMGVTAEEASAMASKGEIDFATFQAAMEEGLGGAAQESGKTFSGAMANVGAALGRVGANLLGGVFPHLAPLFQGITKALKPVEQAAAGVGDAIGQRVGPALERAANFLTNDFVPAIDTAKETLAGIWDRFGAATSGVLEPAIDTARGMFGNILPAVTEALTPILDVAREVFAQLGPAIGDLLPHVLPLVEAFFEVSQAIRGPILEAVLALLPVAAELISTVFEALAPLLPTITTALQTIGQAFSEVAQQILPMIPTIAELVASLVEGLLPILPVIAELAGELATALAGVLAEAVQAILPIAMSLIEGVFLILEPLLPVIVMLVESLGGVFLSLVQAIMPLVEPLGAIIAQLVDGLAPILAIVVEVGALVAATLVTLFDAFSPLIPVITDLLSIALNLISLALQPIISVVQVLAPILTGVLGGAVKIVVPIIGGLVKMFTTLVSFITGPVAGAFTFISSAIRSAFSGIANFLGGIFRGIANAIKAPINFMIDGINRFLGGLSNIKIPDWVPGVGGRGFNIAKLPRLAQGATVLPRPGGTAAILAEAGRAETVVDTGKMNALIDRLLEQGAADSGDDRRPTEIHVHSNNPDLVAAVVAEKLR